MKRSLFELVTFAWIALALLGLIWTPYDPQAQSFRELSLMGFSKLHWLGVDGLGRDMLSRVWRGSGNTVLLGLAASMGTLCFSAVLLFLEQKGPILLKKLIRGLVSVGISLPVLFLGLILLVFLERSPSTLVLAAALGGVPFGFRQLRIVWVEQKGALYVMASKALGSDGRHMVFFTIWPNIKGQVVSLGKILFAVGILELSGLTFLGLMGDPDFAELGTILRQNQAYLFLQPSLVVWPGILLSGLLLMVHLSNIKTKS
ncbi:MAG: ABC transporter permease [Opitutaceae bacterium]|nr:ABC transporter permease [Opitutaceae bacterium]